MFNIDRFSGKRLVHHLFSKWVKLFPSEHSADFGNDRFTIEPQRFLLFRFGSELQKRLFGKLNDIYQLAPKTDPMRNLVIHQKFIEFLILLFLNQDANIYSNEAKMSSSESKVYAVASYIHAHYQDDLSLEGLAQQFGISSSYLSHRFKDVTGFSVTDYVQMTRIRNAQALLINTKIPITEISEPCGFNCFSQFNRVFRKHIGMSPSTYRKKYQGQRSIVV